jgi:hypothetical protein
MNKFSDESNPDPLAVIKVAFEKMPAEMRTVLNIVSFMLASLTIFMYMYVINQVIEKLYKIRHRGRNYVQIDN